MAVLRKRGKAWNFEEHAAYVIIGVGKRTAIENAVFVQFLSEHIEGLDAHVKIRTDVVNSYTQVIIRMMPEDIGSVARWLRSLRKQWHGLIVEMKAQLVLAELAHVEVTEAGAKVEF